MYVCMYIYIYTQYSTTSASRGVTDSISTNSVYIRRV